MIEQIKMKWGAYYSREKALIIGSLFIGVILSLWISSADHEKQPDQTSAELIVPTGYLVIPIELTNATALASLIAREAVIDIFFKKRVAPLAENLKVIKLSAGEGPLFGALVPQKIAGQLQSLFSSHSLTGAIRTRGAAPVSFHLASPHPPTLLEEISTTDTLSGDNI